ncbi:MAG: site-specific integrase [Candidatus Bathyarchaeota archaeon]|nr:site-specific integrase [Candidatus Bathyarchaeota archaeon]
MAYKVEIYHYERKISRALDRVSLSSLNRKNRAAILGFYDDLLCKGLSNARVLKYINTLESLARLLGKPFEEAAKSDIADLLRQIETGSYSDWTKHDYKVILKIFYRWLRGTEGYPEEVKWIKALNKTKHLLPEDILTEEEIKVLAECADNLRNKAFILTLYDSGCRIGEILTLRIRDVTFDEYGAVLIVDGKTGMRRVRIIASTPKLTLWLENHPLRENPDAPLWVNFSTNNRHGNLSYGAVKIMLKEVASKTGIKKKIYPHLFRHSRATHLAKFLTEAQMNVFFGWKPGSKMPSIYVHLSGRDVDAALFKLQGIKVEEKAAESLLKRVSCPKCTQANTPDSKFCMRCGSPLDVGTALKVDELRVKADRLMTALTDHPDVLNLLIEKTETIKDKN